MKKIILGFGVVAFFSSTVFATSLAEHNNKVTSKPQKHIVTKNKHTNYKYENDEKNALANFGKPNHHTKVNRKPRNTHGRNYGHLGYYHGYRNPPIYISPIAPYPDPIPSPYKRGSFISAIKQLNLTTHQRREIRYIVDDYNDDRVEFRNIFSYDRFNRHTFLSQQKSRAKKRANMIEDIYEDVLNTRQRRRLARMFR